MVYTSKIGMETFDWKLKKWRKIIQKIFFFKPILVCELNGI